MAKRSTSLHDLGRLFGKEPEPKTPDPPIYNENAVYSTESGRITHQPTPDTVGYIEGRPVVISQQRKGRGGKTVSVIENLPLSPPELNEMAARLRQKTGTGGTVKNHTIELQGNHIERLRKFLVSQGFTVTVSG